MYKFIDVNEVSESVLPSEALKLNGEYIEKLVEGYRTLTVTGREALSPELDYFETGVRDGSKLKSKRYPGRTITVKYQLITQTAEAFREAFNKLAGILDVENAEMIFNDEPDKFFKGTPSMIGSVEPGKNSVIGEIDFFCADPFKYSVVEYEGTPDLDTGSILIDYGGTYKSFPTLRAEFYNEADTSEDGGTSTALTGGGDCGYIAFFNENEKIIQLGNPDEVDSVAAYAKSQTLVNSAFKTSTAWGTAAKSQWAVNSGITTADVVVQTGSVGMGVASYAVPASAGNTSGTLLKVWSDTGAPLFYYTVTAKATNRTANSVKVNVTITASLKNTSSYFGRGFSLKASVYIGGAWHSVTLKTTSEYWRGQTGHTVNLSCTVSGLSSTTNALTGIQFKVERTDSVGGSAGILSAKACSNLAISTYTANEPESYYLTPTGYGSGTDWHGPSITRGLPADAAGEVGAKNFTLTYAQKMCIGSGSGAQNEVGAFQVLCVSGSGNNRKIVAGVNVYKGGYGKVANLRFYVNNKTVLTMQIDLTHNNQYFNASKSSTIKKTGQTISFNIGGISKTFKDSELANVSVNEITFTFTRYGTKTGLSYNGLYWAKFVKDNCNTYKDVPNKFSANDIVEADCENGKVYLNGVLTPSLGALGNDWEDFYLTPGLNQIGFSYSDWVETGCEPAFKVLYREVFL
jgi:predicted phage tail component-like protein